MDPERDVYASDFECEGCGEPERDDLVPTTVAGSVVYLCRDCREEEE